MAWGSLRVWIKRFQPPNSVGSAAGGLTTHDELGQKGETVCFRVGNADWLVGIWLVQGSLNGTLFFLKGKQKLDANVYGSIEIFSL